MLSPVPPSDCDLAREAASRRLDGELSELEWARLDAHLRECGTCREFAVQTAAITGELRRAPLEPLAVPAFEPRRRPRASALRLQAAAAVLAVAAVGGSFTLGRALSGGGGAPAATSSTTIENITRSRADSVEQRLLAQLPLERRRQRARTGAALAI